MTLVRLEPTAPRSRVKHSTTEPLRSLPLKYLIFENIMENGALAPKEENTSFSIIFSKVFKTLLNFFLFFFNVV